MRTLAVIALVAGLVGCTDAEKTRATLDSMGFTNIEPGGYDVFACGEDYQFHTHFRATNPNGHIVEGTVCCGFLKGCSAKF